MKYSQEKLASFCDRLRHGSSRIDACILEDIAEWTFYTWMKKDPAFAGAVKKSEGEFKNSLVVIIEKAAVNTWQAAAWLLERKYHDEYSQHVKSDVSGYLEQNTELAEYKERKKRVTKFLGDFTKSKNEKQKQLVTASR